MFGAGTLEFDPATWRRTALVTRCEFTVSAKTGDRRAVRLTRRQQRLLRAGTNVGRTNGRMRLTGTRWPDPLAQLSESAFFAPEVAVDGGDDDPSPPGAAYGALINAISVKPELG